MARQPTAEAQSPSQKKHDSAKDLEAYNDIVVDFGLPPSSAAMSEEFDLMHMDPTMRSVGNTAISSTPASNLFHSTAPHGPPPRRSSSQSTFRGGRLGFGDISEEILPGVKYASLADSKASTTAASASRHAQPIRSVWPNQDHPQLKIAVDRAAPLSLERPELSSSTTPRITAPAQVSKAVQDDAIEPPPLPFELSIFPLEQCHFYTDTKPRELYTEIEDVLQEKNVSFDFNSQKFKFTCEYLAGYNIVRFVIRAYRVEDMRIVVEFQRRAGCCMMCAKVVESLRSGLGFCSRASPRSTPHAGGKVGLTEPLFSKAKGVKAPCASPDMVAKRLEELRCCLSMSQEDVQPEFAKALIPLSHLCPDFLSCHFEYADLLTQLAHHATPEIRLTAISAIADLAASCLKAQKGGATPQQKEWCCRVLQVLILALKSDQNPHIKREAARALMYMSGELGSEIRGQDGLAVLNSWADPQTTGQPVDQTLTGYVRRALQAMSVR